MKSIIKSRTKTDTGLEVSMVDHWLDNNEMWVTLKDIDGHFQEIIVASAKNATTARKRAINKLKKVISHLEQMDF